MTEEKKSQEGSRTINTGGGAYVEGGVTTHGGDFVGRDKIVHSGSADINTVAEAFAKLYQAVEQMPDGPDKAVATQAVKALEQEAKKGEEVEESAVRKWLNFLAETAPDAWKVAVDTFTNPIKGLNTAFQLIAQKAKAGKEAKESE
jgi:hypothetical protein